MKNLCGKILMGALVAGGWSPLRGGEPVKWNENGHYYEVVAASGIAWQSAKTAAEARMHKGSAGHLVTITSAGEEAFVHSLVSGGEFWAGGYQNPPNERVATNGWTWVNNEGAFPGQNSGPGYANWSLYEPNDAGTPGLEQHLVINHWRGGWNDEDTCLGCVAGYVVEYDALPPGVVSPKCVMLPEGREGRLSAKVSGLPAPQVQWFFGQAAVAGATNATLIFPQVTRAQEGIYWLVASNAYGQATSAPIATMVSNVDPDQLVMLRWHNEGSSVTLLSSAGLGAAATWVTRSNYPPATPEQGFVELEAAPAAFYRLSASGPGPVPAPVFTGAGLVSGWLYTDTVGAKHQIEYVAAATGWTNWQTLTNLVLPASPYLFLDYDSLNVPVRVYRTTPVP